MVEINVVSCPDPTQLTQGKGVWCHKSKSLDKPKYPSHIDPQHEMPKTNRGYLVMRDIPVNLESLTTAESHHTLKLRQKAGFMLAGLVWDWYNKQANIG